MNPKTGQIARAMKMAREKAAQRYESGTPEYWRLVDQEFHRLLREQLSFEDFRGGRGPARNPPPRCPYCGTRMRGSGRRYACPDPDCGYAGTTADIHRAERSTGAYDSPDYLFNPLSPSPPPHRVNPGDLLEAQYETFHGVEPTTARAGKMWVPGELVLLGDGVDVGYKPKDRRSNKGANQPYVHDFGSGVRVYRRARRGEKPNKVWKNFPTNLMVLGQALGLTYRDHAGHGREVKGGGTLAVTPSRRVLVIVGSGGVKYVIEGGNMHVADWIRN